MLCNAHYAFSELFIFLFIKNGKRTKMTRLVNGNVKGRGLMPFLLSFSLNCIERFFHASSTKLQKPTVVCLMGWNQFYKGFLTAVSRTMFVWREMEKCFIKVLAHSCIYFLFLPQYVLDLFSRKRGRKKLMTVSNAISQLHFMISSKPLILKLN